MEMKNDRVYDVICIGQVVQDILVTNVPRDVFQRETDMTKVDAVSMATGGDAANEAVVLARLGNHTGLLGRVDRTNVGSMIFEDMQREGVDTALLRRPEDCETLSSIVFIHPDGSHSFVVSPGHRYTPELEDFDFEVLKQTRAVSAASLFGLGRLDTDGIDRIFRAAREAGAITAADMNFDLNGIGPRALEAVYPHIDYLMPSFNEAVYVTGRREPEEMADYFLEAGVRNVVIKLGERGCYFKNAREQFHLDACPIQAVDTTGCGDNFVAGFLHCLLRGKTHRECAAFASAVGAINALGIGAHMQVRSEQQVLEFMERMGIC